MENNPLTKEEVKWLLDFMRLLWTYKDISAVVGCFLADEKDRQMFNSVYRKFAHEEWKFEKGAIQEEKRPE